MTQNNFNSDLPTFLNFQTASSTYWLGDVGAFNLTSGFVPRQNLQRVRDEVLKGVPEQVFIAPKKESVMSDRRYVRVLVVDPNENIPLDQCMLYAGEEKLTDLTDEELFFELEIKTLLAAHNAKRVKVIDKKVKERTEHLEPAKVRDLKMVVVTVAKF